MVQAFPERFSRAHDRERAGAVYTPFVLAEWVGSLLEEATRADSGVLLDLGAGEGDLLVSAAARLPRLRALGVEISEGAGAVAKRRLATSADVIVDDVLDPGMYDPSLLQLAQHWVSRLGRRPAAVVMNPPWGAELPLSREALTGRGLSVATGQFDSYDVFCELALQMVEPGGVCAFILPDSLLLPEHEPLRRLLLQKGALLMIARLGEGFFEGVYRGSLVVLWRSGTAADDHAVECIRLNRAWRRRILGGDASFDEARHELAHFVPQAQFSRNRAAEFDIEVSDADGTVHRIAHRGGSWTDGLLSSRGAELSKSGEVVHCPRCEYARPLPKTSLAVCVRCAEPWEIRGIRTIIRAGKRPNANWLPFIAGEDVQRYKARPSRWIELGVEGIKYKRPTTPGDARLLVRKTGIGLNVALDTSGAVTNQVVFDYRLKPGSHLPKWYLEYLLGVMCSRVLFAYHMRRSGEAEWRSHPYVTQKTLATLPIPEAHTDDPQSFRQAEAIAAAVRRHISNGEGDLEIEGLVAGLYRLNEDDCAWVAAVLDQAQALAPMRALRLRPHERITPVLVV